MVFLVSYDLNVENNNNDQVREAIRNFGETNPCLESSWLVSTQLTADQIYDAIIPTLGPGDRFFVTPVKYAECAGRTDGRHGVWEWFGNHPQ